MQDGTYDFADLVDVNQVLDAKEENERRMAEWMSKQRNRR
jgi:hypothetical protein